MRQESADRFATIAVVDTNGLLRGQKVAASEMPGILASAMGMGMSQAHLALDSTDVFLSMPGVTDGTGDFHDSALTVDTSSFHVVIMRGEFHGTMAATTPTGSRTNYDSMRTPM